MWPEGPKISSKRSVDEKKLATPGLNPWHILYNDLYLIDAADGLEKLSNVHQDFVVREEIA